VKIRFWGLFFWGGGNRDGFVDGMIFRFCIWWIGYGRVSFQCRFIVARRLCTVRIILVINKIVTVAFLKVGSFCG
jgi:hypothetical protein